MVLLFRPSAMQHVTSFYPFDTGALASGRLGSEHVAHWPEYIRLFGLDARVISPEQYVAFAYGSNEAYLRGEVSPGLLAEPSPMPLLYNIVRGNRSAGTDHRRYAIECHSAVGIELDALEQVWIPRARLAALHKLGFSSQFPQVDVNLYDDGIQDGALEPALRAAIIQSIARYPHEPQ